MSQAGQISQNQYTLIWNTVCLAILQFTHDHAFFLKSAIENSVKFASSSSPKSELCLPQNDILITYAFSLFHCFCGSA